MSWKAVTFISHPTSADKVSRVEKKNIDGTLKMPKGVTTDVQLQQRTNRMHIPYFRGIFMRTTLSVEGVR